MAEYKICPNCKRRNPPEELICIDCMTDISTVIPVEVLDEDITQDKQEDDTQDKRRENKTTVDEQRTNSSDTEKTVIISSFLILKNSLFSILVKSGEIVGRHFNGAEHLQQYKTVSRKHAKFTEEFREWYIEDLNSTNGTYLNGEKLEPGKKYKIKNGDMIALSSEVKFTVEIKP